LNEYFAIIDEQLSILFNALSVEWEYTLIQKMGGIVVEIKHNNERFSYFLDSAFQSNNVESFLEMELTHMILTFTNILIRRELNDEEKNLIW
jgi:hypothetical protein